MNETSNILETRGISHSFGAKNVCKNIGIQVPVGAFFGFLGENGSGKTTVIRIILQHLIPDDGEILFLGRSLTSSDMLHIGSLVETPAFFPLLSIKENLLVMGRFRNVSTMFANVPRFPHLSSNRQLFVNIVLRVSTSFNILSISHTSMSSTFFCKVVRVQVPSPNLGQPAGQTIL